MKYKVETRLVKINAKGELVEVDATVYSYDFDNPQYAVDLLDTLMQGKENTRVEWEMKEGKQRLLKQITATIVSSGQSSSILVVE